MKNALWAARKNIGKHCTQEWVAGKTGIHHTRISRIENGLVAPTDDEIKSLAKALKSTPVDLFPSLAEQQNAGAR